MEIQVTQEQVDAVKKCKELESEIDELKGINQQLWLLLTCNFFEHVEKWINSQLSSCCEEED